MTDIIDFGYTTPIQSPRSVVPPNIYEEYHNHNITNEFNRQVDNLILSHFLINYNVDSIGGIDRNSIQNNLDRYLFDSLIQNEALQNDSTESVQREPVQREPEINIEFTTEMPTELIIECGICYESQSYLAIATTNCAHTMCNTCITECLKKKDTCPFCRQIVTRLTFVSDI